MSGQVAFGDLAFLLFHGKFKLGHYLLPQVLVGFDQSK